MSSTLLELSNIIAGAVNTLNQACAISGTQLPGEDVPFSRPTEAFRANPVVAEAANVIAAAAMQLAALVRPPHDTMGGLVAGHFKSAALRVCLESNVTEILREGGAQGVHARDIGKIANISSEKIARLLRFLSSYHVYKELSPDVFTNTRISSVLDTGKSVSELFSHPDKKYDNTSGVAALGGHHLDELNKASAYLWENMSDPAVAHSPEVHHAPFNRAFQWDGPLWTFYDQPEQSARQHRFGIAMQGVAALERPDTILKAYDWKVLSPGSVIVDVGGGVGAASLVLAKELPDHKIHVQDLPPVVKAAEEIWQREMPESIKSGHVTLQAHDFFTAQPIKNASVFLLKQIMHDWPDFYASKILTRLREAATDNTTLVIVDSLVPLACHDPSGDSGNGVPGAVPKEAPAPLLPNYGVVNEMVYNGDLTMMLSFNSLERTVGQFQELLNKTGWRMTKVRRDTSAAFLKSIEAVPQAFVDSL